MKQDLFKMLSSITALRSAGFFKSNEKSETSHSNAEIRVDPQGRKLIGAQVFFRHGARTPLHIIPNEGTNLKEATWKPDMISDVPHTIIAYQVVDLEGKSVDNDFTSVDKRHYARTIPGGCPFGQLTRIGQSEMFDLGQCLRDRYVNQFHLIPSDYDSQKVYCRSTMIRRNIISARCVLAGLFGQSLPDKREPILIHGCNEQKKEVLYPNMHVCEVLGYARMTMKHHEDIPLVRDTREKVISAIGLKNTKEVSTYRSNDVESYVPLYYLRDDLVARLYHGFEVPSFILSHRDLIDKDSATELLLEFMGPKSAWEELGLPASVGIICQMILENLNNQISRPGKTQPLMLYATHDSLLVPLLVAVGLFDGRWPKFGASVYFELYEDKKGKRSVQVYYNNEMLKEFTLEEFEKKLQRYAKTDQDYSVLCTSHLKNKLR